MDRRGFFGSFAKKAAAVGAVAAVPLAEAHPGNIPDDLAYKGWRCIWSGFKVPENMDVQIGFWVGYHPKERKRIYASTGGAAGWYNTGDCLNIYHREPPNQWLSLASEEEELRVSRQLCLDRLFALINSPKVESGDL